jgi:hypothetical protein
MHRQIPADLGSKSHEFLSSRCHRDDLALADGLKRWQASFACFDEKLSWLPI